MKRRKNILNILIVSFFALILVHGTYDWYRTVGELKKNGLKAVGEVIDVEISKLYYRYAVNGKYYTAQIVTAEKKNRGERFVVVYEKEDPQSSVILLKYNLRYTSLDSIVIKEGDIPWTW